MAEENEKYKGRTAGRVGAGLFLLLIGGLLLLDQMGFPLPDWLFNWHTLLIAIGIFLGIRHGFRGGAWLILIIVGGFFMLQDYYPHIPFHRFIWPCILILVGLVVILGPRRNRWKHEWKQEWKDKWKEDYAKGYKKRYTQHFASSKEGYSSEDYIDSTAIFGGIHKKIVSKNFKGGDVTSIMGGTELDFTQADFTGTIYLDVTQVMGGTKIIVPPHWEVRSEVTAMFAGFEDKRQQTAITNPDKVMILQGASFFGGIELRNY